MKEMFALRQSDGKKHSHCESSKAEADLLIGADCVRTIKEAGRAEESEHGMRNTCVSAEPKHTCTLNHKQEHEWASPSSDINTPATVWTATSHCKTRTHSHEVFWKKSEELRTADCVVTNDYILRRKSPHVKTNRTFQQFFASYFPPKCETQQ